MLGVLLLACAHHPSPASVVDRLAADASARGWTGESGTTGEGSYRTWCTGLDGPAGCLGAAERPGVGWRTLTTEGDTFTWDAADFPADGTWGGRLFVAGDTWTLRLVRFAGSSATDAIDLARADTTQVSLTDVTLPPDGAPGDFLGLAPAPLADWACGRLTRLQAAADAALARGDVRRCSYGEYDGDKDIVCVPVPLDAAEVAARRSQLRSERERHCTQLRDDAGEIHALLRSLWP